LTHQAKLLWRDVEQCLYWGSHKEPENRKLPKEGRFERPVEIWIQRTFGGWLKAFEKLENGYSNDFNFYQRPFIEEFPVIQREVFLGDIGSRPRLGPAEITKKLLS
jgi:hypothetical protein